MYNPISTYRLQFNKDFGLKDLEKQIEYLALLGVGTVYASPLFKATPGSMHGYDVVNPLEFNPEITNMQEVVSVISQLNKQQIGWLQDIVPNHMAFDTHNTWLMDVLEKGVNSKYHAIFDFEEGVPGPENRLMLPFLGSDLDEAIKNREIQLGWKKGNFVVKYHDHEYPCSFEGFRDILQNDIPDFPVFFMEQWQNHNLDNSNPSADFLHTLWEAAKEKLEYVMQWDKESRRLIDNVLMTFNSHDHLIRYALEKQHYELCHWLETEKRINYRRFFTVNSLICLQMEDARVFEKYHELIAQLISEGYFQGLRVDHIDGLYDPNTYLENLRKLTGDDTFIVAEKILESEEQLPEYWPIQGTTGYDFLATVNNLLTNTKNYHILRKLYKEVTNLEETPSQLIYQNKKMILTTRMHGEWDNLFGLFNMLKLIDYERNEVSHEEIKEAIGEFMLACPVYRLYPRGFPLQEPSRQVVEEIFEQARERNPALIPAIDKLANCFLTKDMQDAKKVEKFFARLMQFTGPLMAKGVEDTSMYQYNAFITHNEVGDALNARGISAEAYHRQMKERQENWPLTMNTTSTHDTKRGEDVRARLSVISELTGEWEQHVRQWMQLNQRLKIRLDSGLLEPGTSVEYFIYQTLLGTFPMDGKADENYKKRMDEYLVKALREAKRKVSWRDPDETYENAICEFTRNMLEPEHGFLEIFIPFQQKMAWRGIVNSLTQLTLKCCSPGVPDIYQGTELWDLSLVDPDNRQAVDYEFRLGLLKEMIEENKADAKAMLRRLSQNPLDGKIKLWLTYTLLNLRKQNPDLFLKGQYLPLRTEGSLKENLLAFARTFQNQWLLVVVPLITADLSEKPSGEYISELDWEGTQIILPKAERVEWINVFNGEEYTFNGSIKASEIFVNFGVGLIMSKQV
jgi:malto-oligosyltrehalose synthase